MSDNKRFVAGLLLGAAAGAALGLFLSSDKGKSVVNDLKDMADKAGGNLKNTLSKLSDEVNDVVENGKEYAEELGQKARNVTS